MFVSYFIIFLHPWLFEGEEEVGGACFLATLRLQALHNHAPDGVLFSGGVKHRI